MKKSIQEIENQINTGSGFLRYQSVVVIFTVIRNQCTKPLKKDMYNSILQARGRKNPRTESMQSR